MSPTNYEMAHECMHAADGATRVNTEHAAVVDALAAQTYATLALVDAVRELGTSISCEFITEVVAEEVSSALVDVFKDQPTRIGGVA